MTATDFHTGPVAASRLVDCLSWPGEGDAAVLDPAHGSAWTLPPSFPDGAGGLVGTSEDLLTFGRALLDAAQRQPSAAGTAPLPAAAVQKMTTEQVPLEQRTGGGNAHMFLDPDTWGYGVSIRDSSSDHPARYGWAGGLGTFWHNNPEHDLVAIVTTQCMPPPMNIIDAFYVTLEQHLDDGGRC